MSYLNSAKCRLCLWNVSFVLQGISIVEEPDGSLLTVQNLQPDDEGLIECVAVNSVGKAVAASRLTAASQPYCFLKDEMVRLKFDFEAQPPPAIVQLIKDGVGSVVGGGGDGVEVSCRDGVVIFRVDNIAERHAGKYQLRLENDFGAASLEFLIQVRQSWAK